MGIVYIPNQNFKVREDPNPNNLVVCRICNAFFCWIGNHDSQEEHVKLHEDRGDCY